MLNVEIFRILKHFFLQKCSSPPQVPQPLGGAHPGHRAGRELRRAAPQPGLPLYRGPVRHHPHLGGQGRAQHTTCEAAILILVCYWAFRLVIRSSFVFCK